MGMFPTAGFFCGIKCILIDLYNKEEKGIKKGEKGKCVRHRFCFSMGDAYGKRQRGLMFEEKKLVPLTFSHSGLDVTGH